MVTCIHGNRERARKLVSSLSRRQFGENSRMYPEVRVAVVALALLAAAAGGFFAQRVVARNLYILKSWTKMQARVASTAASNQVSVELPGDPYPNVLNIPLEHPLGLSVDKKIPVYVDPGDRSRVQLGGLLQLWLWPFSLAAGAAICLIVALIFARAGAGEAGDGWHISAPPPQIAAGIRVVPPDSEPRAFLFWSLLGAGAIAASALSRSAMIAPRTALAAIGALFMLGMWASALERRTMEIRADSQRIRKSSAFGWIEMPWERIARVVREETIPDERTPGFLLNRSLPFPGKSVELYAFRDHKGRMLFTMSIGMGPADSMGRLLDLCEAKTRSAIERKTIRAPVF